MTRAAQVRSYHVPILIGLLLIACLVRLLTVMMALRNAQYRPEVQLASGADMTCYTALAVSLSKGEGYSTHYAPVLSEFFRDPLHMRPQTSATPTVCRTIGYPLFLALIFRIFGYHILAVLLIQALLSAFSVLVVYVIGRQVGPPRLALIACALAASYYPLWYKAIMLLSENLLIALTLLSLYGLIRWFLAPNVLTGCWAGAVVGATFLTKPVLAPVLPLFLLAAYRYHAQRMPRAFWAATAALVVAMLAVVSCWGIRNFRQSGRWIVTPSIGGYHLLLLYNETNRAGELYRDSGFIDEGYPNFQAKALAPLALHLPASTPPVLAEHLQDQAYGRAAIRFLLGHPGHFFRMIPRTMWNTWRPTYPRAKLIRKLSDWVWYVGLTPFVLAGVVIAVRRRNIPALLLAGFLAYVVAYHAVLASQIRYRIIAMPVWFILAALGLTEMFRWWSYRRKPQPDAAVLIDTGAHR